MELSNFLLRHNAKDSLWDRLESLGVETLEQAWDKASDEDLIWAVTRPGVMNSEQRRLFLVMVLSSIEDKLTDPRSLNILTKLRTNEPITDEDLVAARAATRVATWAATWATRVATWAATWAAREAAREATWAATWAAREAAARAATWAATWAAREVASDASDASDSRAAQAKWVRENFNLCDLHIN